MKSIGWLYPEVNGFDPYFSRGMSAGFQSLKAPLFSLGLNPLPIPFFHIAGTNGKGSVCHYLKAGLKASGKRVATFTSPHLICPTERIDLPDGLVNQETLLQTLETLDQRFPEPTLTFFELSLLAFLALALQEQAEVLIIETGLGGLLDTTNVLEGTKLGAVTSISLDHTQILGNSEEEILLQKLGIGREGQTMYLPQTFHLLEKALHYCHEKGIPVQTCPEFPHPLKNPALHQPALAGIALRMLLDFGVSEDVAEASIYNTMVPARQEWIPDRKIFLDVCHNPAGFETSLGTLASHPQWKIETLFFTLMKDKNLGKVLEIIQSSGFRGRVFFVELDFPRARRICPEDGLAEAGIDVLSPAQFLDFLEGRQPVAVLGSFHLAEIVLNPPQRESGDAPSTAPSGLPR